MQLVKDIPQVEDNNLSIESAERVNSENSQKENTNKIENNNKSPSL